MGEFVATGLFVVGQFQSIQSGRGGQRGVAVVGEETILTEWVGFVSRDRQERIVAQLVVVIEVAVAQRDGTDPLEEQLFQGVIDEASIVMIDKAAGQAGGQAQALIDLAQEQNATVCGEGATRKIGFDAARTEVLEQHGLRATGCRSGCGGLSCHR
jgi:hypothetical protein